MEDVTDYPGTAHHQRVLRAIVAHYATDPRVLAVIVFGSLGRGDWDEYSDLDLDIVITDEARLDPMRELQRLGEALAGIGERVAVLVPDGPEAGDLVLVSLLGLSVRYHPLATTSPYMVTSMRLLWGQLDAATVRTAGLARAVATAPLTQVLGQCVRAAAETDTALLRQRPWAAIESLHRLRTHLMTLFSRARGGARPVHGFDAMADARLRARLAGTLPTADLAAIRAALLHALDVIDVDLDHISKGQVALTTEQREVLGVIRAPGATGP